MLALDAVVHHFARGVVVGIQTNIRTMDVLGYGAMNNTGRAAASINYEWKDGVLTFYSTWEHIWTLEFGRAPGKQPPMEPILTWVQQRGIGEEKERKSIAYLIARNIAENGTQLNVAYRKSGKGSGILSQFIDRDYILSNLSPNLQDIVIKQVTENILQAA